MNSKSTLAIIGTTLTIALSGCAGHQSHGSHGLTTEQVQNWNEAAANYKACNKVWWPQQVAEAPQWDQLVNGHNDPQFLQKMTSKAPVTKAMKEALIKYRPQQMACRKALFDDLSNKNPSVRMMYQKNFNTLDEGIVKLLEGKFKTIGELNQFYLAYNNDVIERQARLMIHSPSH
jgi:hypothetical protein